jgi:hypothetical protein
MDAILGILKDYFEKFKKLKDEGYSAFDDITKKTKEELIDELGLAILDDDIPNEIKNKVKSMVGKLKDFSDINIGEILELIKDLYSFIINYTKEPETRGKKPKTHSKKPEPQNTILM